jgi:NAD-dependent deacetylase
VVKPDVVLYEEALDQKVLNNAVDAIARADTLIVGGTSLVVYPAAGLINYFRGDELVLINKSSTPYDRKASLVIHESIGDVLGTCVLTEH